MRVLWVGLVVYGAEALQKIWPWKLTQQTLSRLPLQDVLSCQGTLLGQLKPNLADSPGWNTNCARLIINYRPWLLIYRLLLSPQFPPSRNPCPRQNLRLLIENLSMGPKGSVGGCCCNVRTCFSLPSINRSWKSCTLLDYFGAGWRFQSSRSLGGFLNEFNVGIWCCTCFHFPLEALVTVEAGLRTSSSILDTCS